MCGIAGFYHLSPQTTVPMDLKEPTRLLLHRGPDEEGYYEDSRVGLGMRRLSIIDLLTGQQPMGNEAENIRAVFNGEIYNYRELRGLLQSKGHRFKSRSDTEVIVHGYEEWGEEVLGRLRGMFALALWDAGKSSLLLARDHFGIKPLYYARVNQVFLFASEMKALLADGGVQREIDPVALDQYLSFLYIPEPRTIFTGVKALPPAHYLVLREDEVTIRRYWKFEPCPDESSSLASVLEDIRSGMEESVRSMSEADVPLGVFLSGGMDSTAILALISRHSREKVRTFTLGFGAGERNWNELDAARRVASFFRTDHHEFRVQPKIVEDLPLIIRHFDQPFANPTSLLLYYLSAEARRFVKVALAGTGGDEMFAGYPRYKGMVYHQSYEKIPSSLRRGISVLGNLFLNDGTDGNLGSQRIRRFLDAGDRSFAECYLHILTALDERRKEEIYTDQFRERLEGTDPLDFIRPHLNGANPLPPLEKLMEADLNTYLPFNQLVYCDRMSMACSLEVRVPFVDQQVVKVAGRIPLRQKLLHGRTKGLFREAMAPFLPPEVLRAPKLGLNLPIALWFRKELREWMRSLLSPERVRRRGYIHPEAVQAILTEHDTGKRDRSLFIWALLVLEIWHQIYIDGEINLK
jgi:asparagine synthase (glutamine-hydrolysing)